MKQSGGHMRHSTAYLVRIKGIKFSLLSKYYIDRWAVVELTNENLYTNREPTHGGLNDQRMGVTTTYYACLTCGYSRECQGHFGVIKLPEPIFHYGFLKFVYKVVKCICHSCGKLRKPLKKDGLDSRFSSIISYFHGRRRLIEMSKLLVNISECHIESEESGQRVTRKGCGNTTLYNRVQLRNCNIYVSCKRKEANGKSTAIDQPYFNEKHFEEKQLTADVVYKMFYKIDGQDAALLGFTDSKPIDLLISSLLVCPPQLRPIIETSSEKKTEDSITNYYNSILKLCNIIHREKKDIKEIMYNEKKTKIEVLELEVASIIQKVDKKGLKLKIKQNNKEVKSFADRLKGKEGRFRQNLMGKRVDFSARSVISPDSNLALDELGVPQKVADNMTFPEEITMFNRDRIKKLFKLGKIINLLKPSQDRKKYEAVALRDEASFYRYLTQGVIVERCLEDGDFVLFNRQPTLHRMSMMGHRVRILPYNTFRLNLSVCAPYNADFDGDEMNMHVPQSYETLAYIKHIAHVPRQIVTPKNNAPVMGMVQDALLGIFLFTLRDTFLTREEAMNLVIWIDSIENKDEFDQLQLGELPIPAIIKPVPLWTGKQIMSMILPSKISMVQKKNVKEAIDFLLNAEDSSMIIRRGELIMGALQKEIVGSGAGGLIHQIWLDHGPDATNYFLTTAQRIVNNWLMMSGFTVGASDVVPTPMCYQLIKGQKLNAEKCYLTLLETFRSKYKMEEKSLHHRYKTIFESIESHLNSELNSLLTSCQKVVTSSTKAYINNIYKMIWAKSKGSDTNLTQIVGILANQNVEGRRIPDGFNRRTLPHFCKDDKSPEPKGFVYSSFYTGLKPHEFFFHSMGGREGLSDTAVKTARTGYIQRKLIKALEDVIVKYDGSVRDSQGNLIQILYGYDGFAAEYIEKQIISLDYTEDKFSDENRWNYNELTSTYNLSVDDIEKLDEYYEILLASWKNLRNTFVPREGIRDMYCPIKVDRLIYNIRQKESRPKASPDLSPLFVYQEVENLLDVCIHPQFQNEYKEIMQSARGDNLIRSEKQLKKRKAQFEKETGLEFFRSNVRLNLSSKKICKGLCLTRNGFIGIIELIKAKFTQSLINPGEAVGAIAAQCVGYPTTQMTLNTFHSAGIKANNVTLGVPRLQYLVEVSRNMKTASLKIFIDKDYEKYIGRYIKELPEMYLGDFIVNCKMYYDWSSNQSNFIENRKLEDEILPEEQTSERVTPWLMMLTVESGMHLSSYLNDKMKYALNSLTERWAKMTKYHTNDGKIEVYLRCYEKVYNDPEFEKYGKMEFNYFKFLKDQESKLRARRIEGIDGIKKIYKAIMKTVRRKPNGYFEKGTNATFEYPYLVSYGTNLRKVLSLPMVDSRRTTSNNPVYIQGVLGIEAARQLFLNEFREVLKPYNIYINYRHLATLADWMTRRGKLIPVNRNGINRISDVSVLRKASFYYTVEILYDAAIFSELDPLKGVSEKIIVGETVEIGTGNFEILIDTSRVNDFKIDSCMANKEDLPIEEHNRLVSESIHDFGTPRNIMTPMPYGPGSSYRSVMSPHLGVGTSPIFTANYHDSSFTPNVHEMVSTTMGHSPMMPLTVGMATPILNFGHNIEYSPSASPGYPSSPHMTSFGKPMPSPMYNRYPTMSPRFPTASASPSYSPNNRSAYDSSRHSQSPRYSPESGRSPGYSSPATPNERPKGEEKMDDDDEYNS